MQLVKYEAACRAIQEAVDVDEVLGYHNMADRMRAAAKVAKNKKAEMDMAEIRIRAERRLGEMLKNQPKAKGGQPYQATGVNGTPVEIPTLSDIGVDKNLAKRARKIAAVPQEKYDSMLGEWKDRVSKEGQRVTTNLLREGERAQRDEQLKEPIALVDLGEYEVIYCDPPWRYEHVKTESRAIENQYPTMPLDDIKAMEIPAADDCVLFMWATAPKLAEAMEVITAWGFTYRTCAVWDKEKIGMGYYFRQQHELLLVAAKGKPGVPDPSARVSSVFRESRGEHSAKPHAYYEMLESMYPNHSKAELFARNNRENWVAWGNQSA